MSTNMIQRIIRLKPEQDDKLRKIAFDRRISVAAVVREIVLNSLNKKK